MDTFNGRKINGRVQLLFDTEKIILTVWLHLTIELYCSANHFYNDREMI